MTILAGRYVLIKERLHERRNAKGSLRRAFSFVPMACHTCDYINNEILRKAKEAADALLALVKPEPDALKQDGTQQG